MRKAIILILGLWMSAASAQTVKNVNFRREGDKVVVTYDLDKETGIVVYAVVGKGAKEYRGMFSVSGDVGKAVTPGKKQIIWEVAKDFPEGLGGQVSFKVIPRTAKSLRLVQPEMVFVKGGTFTMGVTPEQGKDASDWEMPARQVTLSDYYIGKYEVTQGLWKAVMGENPSYFAKGDDYPVEKISWHDARAFIGALRQLTGKRYVLPTEAQWEFAARGGNNSAGYKYSGSNSVDSVAWHVRISDTTTHPVAMKKPNELGIYDMGGNVWEWCQDWYGDYSSKPQTNPTGPATGSYRVLRGGSWSGDAWYCRVSDRNRSNPECEDVYCGFRIALLP